MSRARILYLDGFTRNVGDSEASDEIGYGRTSNDAIKFQLRELGFRVDDLQFFGICAQTKHAWIHDSYKLLSELSLELYDVIFIFHSFHHFPSEVRRIVLDRGFRNIKIVGYTHGSHWDPSDTYRETAYPGMAFADLGNLLCLDRILVVSNHLRDEILKNVQHVGTKTKQDIDDRIEVTGLPINNDLMERYRTAKRTDRIQIVFNHSSTVGKAPDVFFDVMGDVLQEHDVDLVVTRRFLEDKPGADRLRQLTNRFGPRVVLGETMPLDIYYRTLWESHIQVSTATHESLGIATLEAMYTYNCCLVPNRQIYPALCGSENVYTTERELATMLGTFIRDSGSRQHAAAAMHQRSLPYLPHVVAGRVADVIDSLCNYNLS